MASLRQYGSKNQRVSVQPISVFSLLLQVFPRAEAALTTRLLTLYKTLFVPGKSKGRAAPEERTSWVQMVRQYECIHQGTV